jgi:hypothetical protein
LRVFGHPYSDSIFFFAHYRLRIKERRGCDSIAFGLDLQLSFLDQEADVKLVVKSAVMCIAFAVTGCATVKTPVATGGSRSDGTVELAFTYGAFEAPEVQWDVAEATAKQKCGVWGYSGAEKFGSGLERCTQFNSYGCMQMQVTINYQCTGSPAAAVPSSQPPTALPASTKKPTS